ncbi:ATP-dependent zinc metalloprotease FTSH 8 [Carex littledalei]|uniref:ATP-dependent zinc metalloprotease FTSH 8 n=1 Tax=Carex littledalei TaxID=544730 RepID=A0A833QMC0_9POAL|nr:ATP-dependent zinc metalloprotease FTSH 8 [Carex littledalei]
MALAHIRNNREAVDKIVEVPLEKENLTGEKFRAILSEFVEIPAENRVQPANPLEIGRFRPESELHGRRFSHRILAEMVRFQKNFGRNGSEKLA